MFRSLIALRLQTLRLTCILVIIQAECTLLWNSEDGIHFSTIANELAAFLLRKWWWVTPVRFTFSSGLLAALLDLPAADSSQGNEQHEQAHGQANCYPQSHWGECNVLTWREWKRERRQSLIIHSCTAKTGRTTVTAVSITIYFTMWVPWLSTVHDRTRQLASPHSLLQHLICIGFDVQSFQKKGNLFFACALHWHLIKSLMSLNCAQMADSSPVMQGCVVTSLKQHWRRFTRMLAPTVHPHSFCYSLLICHNFWCI